MIFAMVRIREEYHKKYYWERKSLLESLRRKQMSSKNILWLRREEAYFQRKYLFIAQSSGFLFHKLPLKFAYDTYVLKAIYILETEILHFNYHLNFKNVQYFWYFK